jgi:hypothetical protein
MFAKFEEKLPIFHVKQNNNLSFVPCKKIVARSIEEWGTPVPFKI